MKKLSFSVPALLLLFIAALGLLVSPVMAQQIETPTPTTPPPTATRDNYSRPLIIIQSYSLDTSSVSFGGDSNLTVNLYNSGQHYAYNVVLTFTPGDLNPRNTGGIVTVGDMAPENHASASQPLTASSDLWGKNVVELALNIAYTDEFGVGYSTNFNLTFTVNPPKLYYYTATPTPTITPTPTVAPIPRPQLVITSYTTSVSPLEPGTQFILEMKIENLGNGKARRVTMIVGGGGASGSSGTPDASGGVSGGGGDFTNFAPLGASNVQSLGELEAGQATSASQSLIVNVATNPGAFPMRISFVYLDEKGNSISDDQVITLLVFSLPKVGINFYQDPGMLFAGQPGVLPLQIVNLGRKTAVLGNMKVEAAGGQVTNNTSLVGALDPGGYFTLDSSVIPDQSGPLELTITIDYTDDFNQSQQIVKTLTLEIAEAPVIEPLPDNGGLPDDGGDGMAPPATEETFLQQAWRFILGFVGLDSAIPAAENTPLPMDNPIPGGDAKPVPPLKGP